MVVPQQPAPPLAATHVGAPERASLGRDQLVPEPLRVPRPVGVRDELVEGAAQPTLPEEGEAVETRLADRAHEPFRVGVGIRRLDGRQHDPHPGAVDEAAESLGPRAVSIADEDLVARQEPIDRIGQSGLAPVSWTLQIARKCGRSVPWPSEIGGRLRPSSRPRRCGWFGTAGSPSGRSPESWTSRRARCGPGCGRPPLIPAGAGPGSSPPRSGRSWAACGARCGRCGWSATS
jgi:hypothetical protein